MEINSTPYVDDVECPVLILARRGIFMHDEPDTLYILRGYEYKPWDQHMCCWSFTEVESGKRFLFTTYGWTPRGYIDNLTTTL